MRPRRSIAWFFTLLALAFAALSPRAAWADARTEARRHFRLGMQLIAQKHYTDGIAELQKANELVPHPNVTFNIARAQAEAGNIEAAIASYKEYLASDPPDRAAAAQVLAQLEDKLAAQKAAEKPPPPPTPVPPTPTPPSPTPGENPEPPGEKTPTPPPAPAPRPPPPPGPSTDAIVGAARTEDVYQETVVTASRNAQSPLDAPSSTTIITKQDIQLSGITRIPELLRRVAGMDVMEITGGDANVSMRGFNSRLSNKLLVLVNGRSVYNDILGSTFWETFTIDVDQIERIEVVRGPGSALYGADAFAGVVNIITTAPGEGKGGARVGYGDDVTAYGSAYVSGRDGNFAYRASAGYTRYPRWSREVDPGRIDIKVADFNQNLGADNERIDLRTNYRINRDTSLAVGGGFARGDLDVYGIGPFNDYVLGFENSDITADFKSKHVNLRAYWTRLYAKTDSDYVYVGHTLDPSIAEQNSVDGEGEYADDFTFPEGVRHDVHVGAGYRLKKIDWNYLATDTPIENHVAGYAQDTASIGKHLLLFASGRVDYVPYLQRAIPSPRGAVIIKPTDRQAIRLSGSTAFRSPTFLESYLSLPIQLPLPGAQLVSSSKPVDEPNFILQPEQITTAEINYLNQQSDYFEAEVNAYYNRVTNLVELAVNRNESLSTRQQGLGGLDPATGQYTVAFGGWDNQCDAYNVLGGELGFRVYPVEGLDLFANYALNVSKQSRPAGCNVPDDKRTSMHKVNAGVQVRTKIGFNGEITFHYQSSEVWNEQVATVDRGIVYEQFPLPAYTLLNGKLGFRFYKDKAEVGATVFNALADVFGPPPQQHPFGNRIGRRVMGFLSYQL